MTEQVHQVGDIFAVADYGTYPPRIFFDRAAREHNIELGPLIRRCEIDAHGRTKYICESRVMDVLPESARSSVEGAGEDNEDGFANPPIPATSPEAS